MNPFLRYLADKNSARAHTHTHRQTDRQTDRHTLMTTRPCGLRRAGKKQQGSVKIYTVTSKKVTPVYIVITQTNNVRF